jgi:hypothetical protein
MVGVCCIAITSLILIHPGSAEAASFRSQFSVTPDRVWPGAQYWPNPMENWQIKDGQLQCTSTGGNRNVHLLTHALSTAHGDFETSVRVSYLPQQSEIKRNFKLQAGTELNSNRAPQIANRPLKITARIGEMADDGVIVAQGGQVVGYAVWMNDGKVTFTTRRGGNPTSIHTKPIDAEQGVIEVTLAKGGQATIRVNGQRMAEGRMPGLIPNLPIDSLDVGFDRGTQVGTYGGNSPFQGEIDNVEINLADTSGPAQGVAGFRVGINSDLNNYRAAVFNGDGLNATYNNSGQLRLLDKTKSLNNHTPTEAVQLTLRGEWSDRSYELVLTAKDTETGDTLGSVTKAGVDPTKLVGNVALVNNPRSAAAACFGFSNWRLSGSKVEAHLDRAFGPIMWTMYTLSDSRSEEGLVMKMSAQMPPLGAKDNQSIELEVKRHGQWRQIDSARIHPHARNAIFRVSNWNGNRDVPYRVVYETQRTDGQTIRDTYHGTVRQNPDEASKVSVAGLNCQHGSGFPYEPVTDNVQKVNPDVLFFAGDQLYESNGGYGIVRRPADKAIVSYLRKYFMFGWVFGDVMRNRPTLCIPDDHDVFQGNIWGSGGDELKDSTWSKGGYLEPVEAVNAITRTQVGHHPGIENLEPARRGIKVFYGDMVYGNISLGIVADRQFKTGPREVPKSAGMGDRSDSEHDLKLLGERQLDFLRQWVADWRGAEMKLLLSQTQWADLNTHGGRRERRSEKTKDTGGWPKGARDKAVRVARKGFPFHMNGDQHLATLAHLGVDAPRDAFWGYCPPAISVGYQRWFVPDEIGMPVKNRPEHGLPNTGSYQDDFGNYMYVYAVGNPLSASGPTRYQRAQNKGSGFGTVEFNKDERTITVNAYRFLADLDDPTTDNQFPGWPVTIDQLSNYGRERYGNLSAYSMPGVDEPVVKVYDQATDELVYAYRAEQSQVQPFVFEDGTYTVTIGDPETDQWQTYDNQQVVEHK